jgi:hypothetical protein
MYLSCPCCQLVFVWMTHWWYNEHWVTFVRLMSCIYPTTKKKEIKINLSCDNCLSLYWSASPLWLPWFYHADMWALPMMCTHHLANRSILNSYMLSLLPGFRHRHGELPALPPQPWPTTVDSTRPCASWLHPHPLSWPTVDCPCLVMVAMWPSSTILHPASRCIALPPTARHVLRSSSGPSLETSIQQVCPPFTSIGVVQNRAAKPCWIYYGIDLFRFNKSINSMVCNYR